MYPAAGKIESRGLACCLLGLLEGLERCCRKPFTGRKLAPGPGLASRKLRKHEDSHVLEAYVWRFLDNHLEKMTRCVHMSLWFLNSISREATRDQPWRLLEVGQGSEYAAGLVLEGGRINGVAWDRR